MEGKVFIRFGNQEVVGDLKKSKWGEGQRIGRQRIQSGLSADCGEPDVRLELMT